MSDCIEKIATNSKILTIASVANAYAVSMRSGARYFATLIRDRVSSGDNSNFYVFK